MNVTLIDIFSKITLFLKHFYSGATSFDTRYNIFQIIGVIILRFFFIIVYDILNIFYLKLSHYNFKNIKVYLYHIVLFVFENFILFYFFPVFFFIYYILKLSFFFFYYTCRYIFVLLISFLELLNYFYNFLSLISVFKTLQNVWLNFDLWFLNTKINFNYSAFQFYIILIYYVFFILLLDLYLYPLLIAKTVLLIEKSTDLLLKLIKIVQRFFLRLQYIISFVIIPFFFRFQENSNFFFWKFFSKKICVYSVFILKIFS